MIYLIVFAISVLLIRCADKNKNWKKSRRVVRAFLTCIAILLPSVLAGVRDYSIGTDVLVYGNAWFDYAVGDFDFKHYVIWGTSSSIDLIYCIINYVVARFTDNTHWFYFVFSLITTGLIYKAAEDNNDIVEPYYVMLTYYLLFYNQSLNMLRQSLALAFAACSFSYIRRNQYIRFALCAVLAYLSHRSAIVVVLLLIIYKIVNSQVRTLGKALVLTGSLVALFGINSIYSFFVSVGLLTSRYDSYFDVQQRGGFYVHLLLLCAPYFVLIYMFIKQRLQDKSIREAISGLKYYLLFSTVVGCVTLKMTYMARIVLYFDIMLIYTVPLITDNLGVTLRLEGKNKNKSLMVLWMVIYWIIVYAVRNSGETYPFVFMTN